MKSSFSAYPFGSPMPNRSFSSSSYRYGFNGKENDEEAVGTRGGTQDYGMRIYNPALGKFLSVDPMQRKYPELTPYQFASNRPIDGIDQDGLEYATFTIFVQYGKVKDITVTKDYELKNPNTAGPGVQLNYAYLDKDGKVTKFEAKPNIPNSVYGIYAGDKNPQLPKKGGDPFKLYDDYSLDPIDEVDAAAKKHDLAYDKIHPKQAGMKGVMNDATTAANIDAIVAGDNVIKKYATGEKDNITGKKVTFEEFKGANSLSSGFYGAEKVKPLYNMPSNIYNSIKNAAKAVGNFISDVKYKANEGINAINNMSPH